MLISVGTQYIFGWQSEAFPRGLTVCLKSCGRKILLNAFGVESEVLLRAPIGGLCLWGLKILRIVIQSPTLRTYLFPQYESIEDIFSDEGLVYPYTIRNGLEKMFSRMGIVPQLPSREDVFSDGDPSPITIHDGQISY
ncbi:hypothetical protein C5167_021536 [Papaver somniferum]|nr:hypothetical protein C5167_021536 [Papaver somniferum]